MFDFSSVYFSKLPLVTDDAAIAALLPFNLERKEVHDFAAANWLGLGS